MGKERLVLCDTDVLIAFYKQNKDIVSLLREIGYTNILISVITSGELVYGAINKRELSRIKKDLDHLKIVNLTPQISEQFFDLMYKYSLSHNLRLPDALIAATAITLNVELLTLNQKDFRYMGELKLFPF